MNEIDCFKPYNSMSFLVLLYTLRTDLIGEFCNNPVVDFQNYAEIHSNPPPEEFPLNIFTNPKIALTVGAYDANN